ncbi:MAG: type II toxin-antitoxin system VapC family toxin [Pyrinomonadaceae bacterium]
MNNPEAVVIDASILVSISSKEAAAYLIAQNAFDIYAKNGWEFFAPNVVVGEVLFALCRKLAAGILTETEHEKAVESFLNLMKNISTPDDETDLVERVVEIRGNYGCSRSSDGLYIALAEDLAKIRTVELLTFDRGMINQTAKNAPTVTVKVL